MTDLTLAERLRVYAATSPDGNVTLQMTADQASILYEMLEERESLHDLRASLIAQYRRDRDAMDLVYHFTGWQVCILAAALATWGIMA